MIPRADSTTVDVVYHDRSIGWLALPASADLIPHITDKVLGQFILWVLLQILAQDLPVFILHTLP